MLYVTMKAGSMANGRAAGPCQEPMACLACIGNIDSSEMAAGLQGRVGRSSDVNRVLRGGVPWWFDRQSTEHRVCLQADGHEAPQERFYPQGNARSWGFWQGRVVVSICSRDGFLRISLPWQGAHR